MSIFKRITKLFDQTLCDHEYDVLYDDTGKCKKCGKVIHFKGSELNDKRRKKKRNNRFYS